MKNFTMKIRTSIATAFLVILLLVVGAIVTIQNKSNQEFALITTQNLFENISNKIVGKIGEYDANSDNFISLLTNLNAVNTPIAKGVKHPLLKVFTEYIEKSNQTYGVYVGYGNDSFYQVINLNVSADIKNILKTPIEARWLVVKHVLLNGTTTRLEVSLDRKLNVISIIEKDTEYKPSKRPWYQKALTNDTTIKTSPYIFSSLKKPGVTYARKVSDDIVIGLDVSLESLSKMLSSKELVQKSGAYIFESDGMVTGQYDTFLSKKVKNIDEKYKNIFIKNGQVQNLDKQAFIEIGGKDFITYTQKLPSNFETDEYIVIFSSLDSIMAPLKEKIYTILKYIALGIVFVVVPLILYMVSLVVKPILQLEKENEKVKNGDFDSVKRVDSFMVEINSLSNSLVDMSKTIEQNQRTLESKVEQRTKDIANLLNNAGQGFLSFDSKMVIGEKYSQEAKKIFDNQEIAKGDIIKLLYPKDEEKQSFVTQTLQGILKDDPIKQEILLSLLDKELIINGKNIELEYKILNSDTYMLILTDITTQKELAAKIKKEQQILKMVVETVTTFEQFLEVKKDYEKFVMGIERFDNIGYLQTLRNSVHTYKGLFAQKEMYTVVEELHDFETYIDQSIKAGEVVPEVANMTKEQMMGWISEDVNILKSVLGEEFFNQENKISISTVRIQTILKNIAKYVDENKKFRGIYKDIDKLTKEHLKVFVEPYKQLVKELGTRLDRYIEPLEIDYDEVYADEEFKPFTSQVENVLKRIDSHTKENDKFLELYRDIKKLTYHHVKIFLEPYKKLVDQLALKMDKQIEPLKLIYDEIYLSEKYKPFFNSLVHIFRNSVDHGIETFDERYESGKNEYGVIGCKLKQEDKNIVITINDDGRGIDIEKIKQKAIEKELYSLEELESMDENKIVMLIFNEGFSTSESITNISGRGIGLASTLEELKRLDGVLDIDNRPNQGIKFKFTIPNKG